MKTIFKYPIREDASEFELQLPKGAKILSVQLQKNSHVFWAEVDDKAPRERRKFAIVGTGWQLPDYRQYIGTFQDGDLVWHFFELD